MPSPNVNPAVVADFGHEWTAFDQAALEPDQAERLFEAYFGIFPWHRLPVDARGFDLGCGSGRWARLVAPRVGELHCIDPSPAALAVARRNLAGQPNCRLHEANVDALPLADGSMDFGFSLGVLHHAPDTRGGIAAAAAKLKPGAPLLLYLYYRFDNRPRWYAALWRATDGIRRTVSRWPRTTKLAASQLIAALVYWPLARLARLGELLGARVEGWPLAFYRRLGFYVMRTDALDRFGTRLEQRFTREEIRDMMHAAGLHDVRFSDRPPYWCAVGLRTPGGG
jgi:SAM-dependent methyltransferase